MLLAKLVRFTLRTVLVARLDSVTEEFVFKYAPSSSLAPTESAKLATMNATDVLMSATSVLTALLDSTDADRSVKILVSPTNSLIQSAELVLLAILTARLVRVRLSAQLAKILKLFLLMEFVTIVLILAEHAELVLQNADHVSKDSIWLELLVLLLVLEDHSLSMEFVSALLDSSLPTNVLLNAL